MPLNPKRLGFAVAIAASVFYLGCVVIMALAGPPALVGFFNGLFHGADLGPIMQNKVGAWTTITGLINTFVLSWLFGALVAVVYNGAVTSNRKGGR